jgi:hypothetical protein
MISKLFLTSKKNIFLAIIMASIFALFFVPSFFSYIEAYDHHIGTSAGEKAEVGLVLLEDYGTLDDDLQSAIDAGATSSVVLATYINMIVRIAIGFGSIGAVILIVWGGIEYITAQTFSSKSDGKDKLKRALGALVILFTSFIVFEQLNPELLKVRFEPIYVGDGKEVKLSFSNALRGDTRTDLDQASENIYNSNIGDENACSGKQFEEKAEINLELNRYLAKAETLKSDIDKKSRSKTVRVDDFTETSASAWSQLEPEVSCDVEYESFETDPNEWRQKNSLIHETFEVTQRVGYIDNLIWGSFDNDDCVEIDTYSEHINNLLAVVEPTYLSCKKKIIRDGFLSEVFPTKPVCDDARTKAGNILRKSDCTTEDGGGSGGNFGIGAWTYIYYPI